MSAPDHGLVISRLLPDRWYTAGEVAALTRRSVLAVRVVLEDLHRTGYVDRQVGDPLVDHRDDEAVCRWRIRESVACLATTRHHRQSVVCSLEAGHAGPHCGGRHVWSDMPAEVAA